MPVLALLPALTAAAVALTMSPAAAAPAPAVSHPPASASVTSKAPGCAKVVTKPFRGRQLVVAAFCGTKLTDKQIAQTLRRAGFSVKALPTATATVLAESGGYTMARHVNRAPDGRVLSTDYDLWQLNDRWHPKIMKIRRGDALASSKLALTIARRYGFDTWHGYDNRHAYMARAKAACAGIR